MGAGPEPKDIRQQRDLSHKDVSTEHIFRSEFLRRQRKARKAKYKKDLTDKQDTEYILTGRRAGQSLTGPDASFFTFKNITAYCLCLIGTYIGSSAVLMGPAAYNIAMNPITSVDGQDEFGGYILMLLLFLTCSVCALGMSALALVELVAREDSAWEDKNPIDLSLDHKPMFYFSVVLIPIMATLALFAPIASGRFDFNLVAWIGFILSLWFARTIHARYKFAKRYNDAFKRKDKS